MRDKAKHLMTVLAIAAVIAAVPNRAAVAMEIWVTPAKGSASERTGDWAVTPKGDTVFTFAVPENMEAFAAAKIVVIPATTAEVVFELGLSVSSNGQAHDAMNAEWNDLPLSISEGVLQEVDVSPMFASVDLVPGIEYVSMRFRVATDKDLVQVAGLRFQYEGPTGPVGPAGPAGPVGAKGDPGGPGLKGIQGEKGDAGPLGPAPQASWTGASLKLENPDGSWGTGVDLTGPLGAAGPAGPQGPEGPAGNDYTADCDLLATRYLALYGATDNLPVPAAWLPARCRQMCSQDKIDTLVNEVLDEGVPATPSLIAIKLWRETYDSQWDMLYAECAEVTSPLCTGYDEFLAAYPALPPPDTGSQSGSALIELPRVSPYDQVYLMTIRNRMPLACFLLYHTWEAPETITELSYESTETMLGIASAVMDYNTTEQTLPASLNDLVPGYLPELPESAWHAPFEYELPGDGSFKLISLGSDRQWGRRKPEDDDITVQVWADGTISVVPSRRNTEEWHNQVQTMGIMRWIHFELLMWEAEWGSFPATLSEIDGIVSPTDAWGNDLVYAVSTDKHFYTLTSYGSDGLPGPPPPDPWYYGQFYDSDITVDSNYNWQLPGRPPE